MREFYKMEHFKIKVMDTDDHLDGSITSQTVEANLLFAILEKLEEIRCCIIDVESSVSDS